MIANGAFAETPATTKPGGILVMRSPWLIQTGWFSPTRPGGIEQPAFGLHLDVGAAELAVMAALDLAAELRRHGHLAVADAEHGNAGIEDHLRRARRALLVHRFRPAGQDHRLRLHLRGTPLGLLERHDFGVDALFAHPTRDQLRDLAAEIDDENLVMAEATGAVCSRAVWAGVMERSYASSALATARSPIHILLRLDKSNIGQYPDLIMMRRKPCRSSHHQPR